MTRLRLLVVLTTSIIGASGTTAKDFYLAGEARDPGVKRWIWYQIVGPRNHPLPIVYLSTQPFKTMSDEILIVLPPARYDFISAYTQARIAHTDCSGERLHQGAWHAIEIAEHNEKHTQHCILPQALACDYLSGVFSLSGIKWTTTEKRTLTRFMLEVQCNTGSADK
jgi:hypothetical protein